ncbi:hypothetical protein CE91St56_53980 [Lachnospiraceae bacterium]|nr:hypothetical protein CE91St56_53980 [Lachnospiraceae bacterium]GKH44352.1 hypothetical protein CE91St57_53260 [Lachnospiraceae bacterium]
MSDEADTLDRSHLHGLKGAGEHSFSVPGTPLCQQAEGHFAPAKFELLNITRLHETLYNIIQVIHLAKSKIYLTLSKI